VWCLLKQDNDREHTDECGKEYEQKSYAAAGILLTGNASKALRVRTQNNGPGKIKKDPEKAIHTNMNALASG
jgi:hypothetical protein